MLLSRAAARAAGQLLISRTGPKESRAGDYNHGGPNGGGRLGAPMAGSPPDFRTGAAAGWRFRRARCTCRAIRDRDTPRGIDRTRGSEGKSLYQLVNSGGTRIIKKQKKYK